MIAGAEAREVVHPEETTAGASGAEEVEGLARLVARAALMEAATGKWGVNAGNVVRALSKDKKCLRVGNEMLDKAGGQNTIRAVRRTNPDGSVTLLKTRAGRPKFDTQGGRSQDVEPPVFKGVLQAFAVPYANLTTEVGQSGYTAVGNFYTPSSTSTSDSRWFSDTRVLPPNFEMRKMRQLGLLDWFDGRAGAERNPRVVTWNNNVFGGRNAATNSRIRTRLAVD
jgi:hypothetical protein